MAQMTKITIEQHLKAVEAHIYGLFVKVGLDFRDGWDGKALTREQEDWLLSHCTKAAMRYIKEVSKWPK